MRIFAVIAALGIAGGLLAAGQSPDGWINIRWYNSTIVLETEDVPVELRSDCAIVTCGGCSYKGHVETWFCCPDCPSCPICPVVCGIAECRHEYPPYYSQDPVAVFIHCMAGPGAQATKEFCRLIPGDGDASEQTICWRSVTPHCWMMDWDRDGDVDLADWRKLDTEAGWRWDQRKPEK